MCDELRRRGHQTVHGDRELARQGDPATGASTAGARHEHHLWRVDQVRALVSGQCEAATFFCGGSRNHAQFIDLFDQVFVLQIDVGTLRLRLEQRGDEEFGGRPSERELVERVRSTGEDTPDGVVVDATAPLEQVVDVILERVAADLEGQGRRTGM